MQLYMEHGKKSKNITVKRHSKSFKKTILPTPSYPLPSSILIFLTYTN